MRASTYINCSHITPQLRYLESVSERCLNPERLDLEMMSHVRHPTSMSSTLWKFMHIMIELQPNQPDPSAGFLCMSYLT